MVTHNRNLKASRTLPNVRDFQATAQEPALMAAIAGAPYILQLTPLYFDAADSPPAWKVWITGQTIGAFMLGTDGMSLSESGVFQAHATEEKIATIIKGGVIPYDQIPDPTTYPVAQTDANLRLALQDGLRAKGFFITNLENVH